MVEIADAKQAMLVLNGLPNIGPISLNRLLDRFEGDPFALLKAGKRELMGVKGVGQVTAGTVINWEKHFDLKREESLLEKHETVFITHLEAAYPKALKEIHDPPIGLYLKGNYRFEDPCIAIVGTRRPTLYGRSVARRLAAELGRLGFCVVSGMARGIDTEAHLGAMEGSGKTVAVMGCGLDIIYPPENLDLYREISGSGAVISEFPFGRRADKQSFPMRNRVVSGLSVATVVVESDVHGGSMITARFAGEQGRQVFAVPGRIDQAAARGCNQLIRDGAILLTSVDDLLDELRYLGLFEERKTALPMGESEAALKIDDLNEVEKNLLHCFEGGEILHADKIARLTAFSLPEITSHLMMLELKRWIAKRADGAYEKIV